MQREETGGTEKKAGRAITHNIFLLLFSHDSRSYIIEQGWGTVLSDWNYLF